MKEHLVKKLKAKKRDLESTTMFAGFDGFIDELKYVIEKKRDNGKNAYFSDKKQFVKFLSQNTDVNKDIELATKVVKLGGSAAILSVAAASLGINVESFITAGTPKVHDVFGAMPERCKVNSIGNPAVTWALEFDKGKIMFADLKSLEHLEWDAITKIRGINQTKSLIKKSSVLALVGFSMMFGVEKIWEQLLSDIIKKIDKKPVVFFDLADPSKCSEETIKKALRIIGNYSAYTKTVLGVNKNEAQILLKIFHRKADLTDLSLKGIAKSVYKYIEVDELVVHSVEQSVAINKTDVCAVKNSIIKKPSIVTGCGDNFSAGYCTGKALDFNLEESLLIASAVSGFYVKNAKSPSFDELTEYMINID